MKPLGRRMTASLTASIHIVTGLLDAPHRGDSRPTRHSERAALEAIAPTEVGAAGASRSQPTGYGNRVHRRPPCLYPGVGLSRIAHVTLWAGRAKMVDNTEKMASADAQCDSRASVMEKGYTKKIWSMRRLELLFLTLTRKMVL